MARFAWLWVILLMVVLVGIGLFLFLPFSQANDIEGVTLKNQLTHLQETLKSDNLTTTNNETIKLQGEIDLKQNLGSKWWNYLGTETFKTIIISVVLAVILALLGYIFKINEIWDAKIREQRQKRINNQAQCIKDTEKMWDKLYRMVSDIRFYALDKEKNRQTGIAKKSSEGADDSSDEDAGDKKNPKPITKILADIENLASEGEEIVNRWHFIFSKMPSLCEQSNKKYMKRVKTLSKTEKSYLYKKIRSIRRPSTMSLLFINILYEAASSVAYYINSYEHPVDTPKIKVSGNSVTKQDILGLQHSLGLIQDVIKDNVHPRMMSILKSVVEPYDGYGDNKEMDVNIRNLETNLQSLFENYTKVKEKTFNLSILPCLRSSQGETCVLDNVSNSIKQAQTTPLVITSEKTLEEQIHTQAQQLIQALHTTDTPQVIETWEFKYSEKTMTDLAKILCDISVSDDIENRLTWPVVYKLIQKG
jgi:hypothetical protein